MPATGTRGTMGTLIQTVAPTLEPITLDQAKKQSRVTTDAENSAVKLNVAIARYQAENATGRQFVTATWQLLLDGFPWQITGLKSPVIDVSSITYVDINEVTQTLSSSLYEVDTSITGGRIRPVFGEVFPDTFDTYNAVTVTFTAGYGEPADVPPNFKGAMLMFTEDLQCKRGLEITDNARAMALLGPDKVWMWPVDWRGH